MKITLGLRLVARVQTSLNLCDISQRLQNKRKQPCRSSAEEATGRRDVSQRFALSHSVSRTLSFECLASLKTLYSSIIIHKTA